MIVISEIKGDCEFEFFGHDLNLAFQGVNPITDEVVDVVVSKWVIVALSEALVHATDVILESRVTKDELIQGVLHRGGRE